MEKIKKLEISVILVLVFVLTGTCIVSIKHIWKHENYEYSIHHRTYMTEKRVNYDTSNKVFHDVMVGEEAVSLYDYKEGSNVRIHYGRQNIEFIIEKYKDNYYVNVVCNHVIMYTNMKLGSSLDKAYFRLYKGDLMFYNEVKDVDSIYDLAIFVNEKNEVDEVINLGSEEIEFSEEGVIYSFDTCESKGVGAHHKMIKLPFSEPREIESSSQTFTWCD